MKVVDYKTAVILYNIGFEEYTQSLYLNVKNGIRAVKGNPEKPEAERTWHTGDLCKRDSEWQIEYPSPNWIPAPYVYDVVIWLEKYMGIRIIPIYRNTKIWTFDIEFPFHLSYLINNDNKETVTIHADTLEYSSLEQTFDNAVIFVSKIAEKYNWPKLLEEKYWKVLNKKGE